MVFLLIKSGESVCPNQVVCVPMVEKPERKLGQLSYEAAGVVGMCEEGEDPAS